MTTIPTSNGFSLQIWVTKDSQTPRIGTVKAPFFYAGAYVHVTEAFDDTSALVVGISGDTDDFIESKALTSTGFFGTAEGSLTIGEKSGYNSVSQEITMAASGNPTTGKCLVVLRFIRIPIQP